MTETTYQLAIMFAALALAGCPKSGPVSSGSAAPTGTDCTRSVRGDAATAQGRLEKGRIGEALLYIEGLVGCEDAVSDARFLIVALDVYEESGRLNEAWSIGRLADERLSPDDPARARLAGRVASFEQTYALITSPRDGRGGLDVRFAGPVSDEATRVQTASARSGRGVLLEGGLRGFWLFPGRYRIEAADVQLAPGERYRDPRP